jgi:hypothetical protein
VHDEAEALRGESDAGRIARASSAEGIARADPRCGVKAGDRVRFAVSVERLHFFDPDSRASLEAEQAKEWQPAAVASGA